MAIGVEDAPSVQATFVRPVTLGWFLKRTLIGIAILLIAMGGLAWLTYASIEPEADGDAAQRAVSDRPASMIPVGI